MIYLHTAADAVERIDRVIRKSNGNVLRLELSRHNQLDPEAVSGWLADHDGPGLIAIIGGNAENRQERRRYEAVRRMAKFKGIDVHICGDSRLQSLVDVIVRNDTDLKADKIGIGNGETIATLMQEEVMTKFQRGHMDIPTVREAMSSGGMNEQEAVERIAWMKAQDVFVNNIYQVNIEYIETDMAHLIIRRLDKQPIHNWSHFQAIKNELLGEACEAVEIYPPESRLVDAKHHYHLWGFRKPGRTLGIGFTTRQVAKDR